ncbi:MAG: redoxin domain-containing protein [Acidobacteria bacterium]|nr:redoxin domain-containing protein [Acidobacteriota bacterium]
MRWLNDGGPFERWRARSLGSFRGWQLGKIILVLLFYSLWAALPALGQTESPSDLQRVRIGSRPPDFLLKDLQGRSHSLKQYEGHRNIVLVFYRGHW